MCSLLLACYTDLYADFGVFERLTQLDKAFPGANVLLFKRGKLPKVSIINADLHELQMTTVVICALWHGDTAADPSKHIIVFIGCRYQSFLYCHLHKHLILSIICCGHFFIFFCRLSVHNALSTE